MTIINDFNYEKPKTLNEALGIRLKYGKSASILAGGTDLIVSLKDEVVQPEVLVDIKALDELNKIEFKDNCLHIGALVTFSELIDSKIIFDKLPILWESCKTVASISIRNRATLVGNICSAVPSLDSAPPLLVYEASIYLLSTKGERVIKIKDWFVGPKKTAIIDDEIATKIVIPVPDKKNGGSYLKLGRYKGEDLAQVCVAVLALSDNTYRIAFGAVGPIPKRVYKIENFLNGNKINKKIMGGAKELIEKEISPITDIRATKEYRTHMAGIMFERGLNLAILRLQNKGDEYGKDGSIL